jgi:hypothetical protein
MENEEIVQGKMIRPLVYITLIVGLLATIVASVIKLTLYVNSNEFVWKFPLELKTHRILTVTPRVPEVVEKTIVIDYPDDIDTPLEQYICNKFGVMDCKIALAVAKAESGLNCDAYNINNNGSVDLSVFQLNSVHLKKGGEWTLENMANCYKNVDLAYELWREQGWEPWVAYKNNSYLAKY